MITIHKTSPTNYDFLELVRHLDSDLEKKNGDSNDFFAAFNQAVDLDLVLVVYINNIPVGCGALKKYDENHIEIKRMYVDMPYRKLGIAKIILSNLEKYAKEKGYLHTVLETGLQMEPAITLYKKCGYKVIENYPPYQNIAESVCFKKAF